MCATLVHSVYWKWNSTHLTYFSGLHSSPFRVHKTDTGSTVTLFVFTSTFAVNICSASLDKLQQYCILCPMVAVFFCHDLNPGKISLDHVTHECIISSICITGRTVVFGKCAPVHNLRLKHCYSLCQLCTRTWNQGPAVTYALNCWTDLLW